ncbi:MAG: primosomal protein N' [Myxococcota bacterium]
MVGDLFAAPAAGFVRVALPVAVDGLFDYAVPAELADGAQPGRRVHVPFDSRQLVGVVVERLERPTAGAAGRLRSIDAVLDSHSVVSPMLIAILREEAARVLCPVGLALAAAMPPGSAPRQLERLALTPRGWSALRSGAATAGARPLLEVLAVGAAGEADLEREAPGSRQLLPVLEKDGLVARERRTAGPRVRPRTRRLLEHAPGLDLEAALAELARAPRQREVLRALAGGALAQRELTRRVPGAVRATAELARRGFLQTREELAPVEGGADFAEEEADVELTAEQAAALVRIEDAIRGRRPDRLLLHGVTGSGKTEVYLRAVAQALAEGRQALVLVPEITLTHQIVARLRARFGDRVSILHSGLRPGERLAQWELLRTGVTPIAVGARSALFAPLEDLGVIVMDEEHEPAYKNEEGFRYHARSLSAQRARAAGCPLVLGSATPSLETREAAARGEIERLVLSHRIGGRPLPVVELVDLERERALAPRGRKLLLSAPLRKALGETLEASAQAILFLNRRGFSTQILCFDCNEVERCKHCDISLVYHATEEQLLCHYCDYRIPPPEVCSACGSSQTGLLGVGTERLVEELRIQFPHARVARLDRDSASRRGVTEAVLADLARGRIDVLVGTQMVAKGHDFAGVRLVGVVNADLSLHFPDFRAAERTFQLLTQVAGRAGRGHLPGRVVIQTYAPEHYAIHPVVEHDYESFYREELAHRRTLGYPPFGHLAHAVVSGPDEAQTASAAQQLADPLRQASVCREGRVELLGPAPSPLARLRGRYRFQLLLKGSAFADVREAARGLQRGSARVPKGVRVTVDLQPIHML